MTGVCEILGSIPELQKRKREKGQRVGEGEKKGRELKINKK